MRRVQVAVLLWEIACLCLWDVCNSNLRRDNRYAIYLETKWKSQFINQTCVYAGVRQTMDVNEARVHASRKLVERSTRRQRCLVDAQRKRLLYQNLWIPLSRAAFLQGSHHARVSPNSSWKFNSEYIEYRETFSELRGCTRQIYTSIHRGFILKLLYTSMVIFK